jgi:hypothetical protein
VTGDAERADPNCSAAREQTRETGADRSTDGHGPLDISVCARGPWRRRSSISGQLPPIGSATRRGGRRWAVGSVAAAHRRESRSIL